MTNTDGSVTVPLMEDTMYVAQFFGIPVESPGAARASSPESLRCYFSGAYTGLLFCFPKSVGLSIIPHRNSFSWNGRGELTADNFLYNILCRMAFKG